MFDRMVTTLFLTTWNTNLVQHVAAVVPCLHKLSHVYENSSMFVVARNCPRCSWLTAVVPCLQQLFLVHSSCSRLTIVVPG